MVVVVVAQEVLEAENMNLESSCCILVQLESVLEEVGGSSARRGTRKRC